MKFGQKIYYEMGFVLPHYPTLGPSLPLTLHLGLPLPTMLKPAKLVSELTEIRLKINYLANETTAQ